MEPLNVILEILKYTIPALVVFLTAYLLVRQKLNSDTQQQRMQLLMGSKKELLPLRLQAYERLAIFLERMEYINLVPRVTEAGLQANQLHLRMVTSIKEEFEHNLSQQIYVSAEVWAAVALAKDDTIKNLNLVAGSVDPKAPSKELFKQLINFSRERGQSANQRALAIINAEVKSLF